jgi:DDE superfamily endonuclease
VLTLDNFSAHGNLSFQPRNIQLEYFEPNLTAFVQPCDAGIIRCWKASYRRSMCMRALDLDDAGEEEIYKLNILEAMQLARDAWDQVSSTTLANCWNHSGIQP